MNMKLKYLQNLALVALLAGCSTSDDIGEPEFESVDTPLLASSGTVIAEYDRYGNGTTVHAQFVNARGVSIEQALEALEVWTPDRELAIDACSLRSAAAPVGNHVELQLLDVGPLSVDFYEERAKLDGRRLPDLLQGISGVVYGNEEGFDIDSVYIPYHQGLPYQFTAPGMEAGGFDAQVVAPSIPMMRTIADQYVDGERTVAYRAGEDLPIIWEEIESDGELYLDIASTEDLDGTKLRCQLEDDGAFTVPGAILEQLRDNSATLEVTLRRVNRKPVSIDGLDDSEVIFAAKEDATLLISR